MTIHFVFPPRSEDIVATAKERAEEIDLGGIRRQCVGDVDDKPGLDRNLGHGQRRELLTKTGESSSSRLDLGFEVNEPGLPAGDLGEQILVARHGHHLPGEAWFLALRRGAASDSSR
jgi:hypothetical protein